MRGELVFFEEVTDGITKKTEDGLDKDHENGREQSLETK